MSFREGKNVYMKIISISVCLGYMQVNSFEMLAKLTKQTI